MYLFIYIYITIYLFTYMFFLCVCSCICSALGWYLTLPCLIWGHHLWWCHVPQGRKNQGTSAVDGCQILHHQFRMVFTLYILWFYASTGDLDVASTTEHLAKSFFDFGSTVWGAMKITMSLRPTPSPNASALHGCCCLKLAPRPWESSGWPRALWKTAAKWLEFTAAWQHIEDENWLELWRLDKYT